MTPHSDSGSGRNKRLAKLVGSAVAVVLAILVLVGWYWSSEPDYLDIDALVTEHAGGRKVTGAATTAALIGVAETLLDKRGGYLSNDRFPPGVWLDNIPNWEYGVLIQVRDLSKAMRDRFSRSQSQSQEDDNLSLAEPLFNFDNDSWMLPATEKEYRNAIRHVESYLFRLTDDDRYNAQFYARADNLRFWLSTVESRLGSLSQRLTASVGQRRLNIDLAGEIDVRQSTESPGDLMVKTPWTKLDDVFYEARGTTWALVHFLRAMEQDFGAVLDNKNARVSLQQIIRELEATQTPLFSPVILNGTGFGVVANHSLTMASYISRANAAIIDLRELLSQG
ncbi:MAG: DUF2333 family protein [Porticoccaceae bacterium]